MKIQLTRIANHEFNRALRVWRKTSSDTEIFKALINERAKALAHGTKAFGMALVVTLWLTANKSEFALKVALIDISIPAAYVNFGLSFLVLGFTIQFINYFVLNEFLRVATNKLFTFDSPWALQLFLDGSNAWSLSSMNQFRFLSSSKPHQLIGLGAAIFVCLPLLFVLLLIYWTVFSVGIRMLCAQGIASAAGMITIFSWMLMLFPPVQIFFMFFPFTFTKNTRYVRWNFLSKIYSRSGQQHPRSSLWL